MGCKYKQALRQSNVLKFSVNKFYIQQIQAEVNIMIYKLTIFCSNTRTAYTKVSQANIPTKKQDKPGQTMENSRMIQLTGMTFKELDSFRMNQMQKIDSETRS